MFVRVLTAPLHPVSFRDGYIGDLLTSLVRVFIPLSFCLIYILMTIYGWLMNRMDLLTSIADHNWRDSPLFKSLVVPSITLLPFFIRLLQCLRRSVESGKRWPHMANALKYTSAILVLSLSFFQPQCRNSWTWISAFVASTLFQFVWDIFQDWGIIVITYPEDMTFWQAVANFSVEVAFRRQKLLGSWRVYISIIVFNFVLRFAWALTLLPPPIARTVAADNGSKVSGSGNFEGDNSGFASSPVYTFLFAHAAPIAASVEVLRRMVWGILRLEQEQLDVLGDDTVLLSRDSDVPSASLFHSQQPAELDKVLDYIYI